MQQFSFWLAADSDRRWSLKALEQAIAQGIPTVKAPGAGEGLATVAQRRASGAPPVQQRVLGIPPLHHGVAPPGEPGEPAPHRREGLLPMPTVVLPMIALGLEPLGGCMVALPPPTACWRHRRAVLGREAGMRDTALVVEWFARVASKRVKPWKGLKHRRQHVILPDRARGSVGPNPRCRRATAPGVFWQWDQVAHRQSAGRPIARWERP